MGGAYLTLLNTIANLGYSAPKVMIFYLMDVAAVRACDAGSGSGVLGAAMSAVDRVLAALGLQVRSSRGLLFIFWLRKSMSDTGCGTCAP